MRILLIRNDNIGDLICSIPAIQLVRRHHPDASIDLLVNSYNAPVVECLVPQWVNRLVIYQKTKHAGNGIRQWIRLLKFYMGLRKGGYDAAILLVGGHSRQACSFARWAGARRILGYGPGLEGPEWKDGLHEVEYSWRLAAFFCGTQEAIPGKIEYPIQSKGSRVGIQITSRKPGNRWPPERFVEIARRIHGETGEKSLLLWSPGDESTPTHPGDDAKAHAILKAAGEVLEAAPTLSLQELTQVLGKCRSLVTPDGGAMHLAAAMGIRVVAMFGQSETSRWRPWAPQSSFLQSPGKTVGDISVDQVMAKWRDSCR